MNEQLCKCGKHDWERAQIGPITLDWGTTVTTWRYCKQCLSALPQDAEDERAAEAILAAEC